MTNVTPLKTTQPIKLVVAISSRALFDMNDSHAIFTEQGVAAYSHYQIEHEDDPLKPGVAFDLVRKLLALNDKLETTAVEVILLSRNSADTGLRIFNSIQAHSLKIERAAFTSGASPYLYAHSFGSHLFLSADPEDVKLALEAGVAAATIFPSNRTVNPTEELRIAFDGDAVLFSDEAERVFKEQGLEQFRASEKASAKKPLPGGPFKQFLAALHRIQAEYANKANDGQNLIRTALVTARSAPTHERVIRTLREWNIRIDEALFLGGMPKGEFLRAFGADIFFDDQRRNCQSAAEHVATGHVPHGVANEGG
jgi:5'-nucleotidase